MTPAPADNQTQRLFVAVELPPAWIEALAQAQAALRRLIETPDGPRLRWVRPEGIHLTLKFLGNVDAQRIDTLKDALAAVVPDAPGFALSAGELGFFASGRRARVLWVGLAGNLVALRHLAGRIDSACAAIGFEPERRPFAPHLTLARVPDGATLGLETIASRLASVRFEPAPFAVERVSLMRSHLLPGGARYERLAAWPA